jgi:hypothetical protein
MPRVQLTLQQLADMVGTPVVILVAFDQTTKKTMQLTVSDLGVLAIAQVVAWLNDRLSTP